jgi:hypothetical protein
MRIRDHRAAPGLRRDPSDVRHVRLPDVLERRAVHELQLEASSPRDDPARRRRRKKSSMNDQTERAPLPDWLVEWCKPVEPVIEEDFVQKLRGAEPEIREAIIAYPPLAAVRCGCCERYGVAARAMFREFDGTRMLLLGMACEPAELPRPKHLGVATDYEVVGYHKGITSEVLRELAATVGDA